MVTGMNQKLTTKGFAGIVNFSKKRNDDKWRALENMGHEANIFVHEKCRKDYMRSRGIEQQKSKAEEEAAVVAGPSTPKKQTLCSISEVFNFHTHCLFCGDVDEEKKYKTSTKNRESMYS